jgi:N-acetylmuramoyl-L-alanine amidase/Peptidase family M23/LysM domain/Mannosyl-glycoprotein endo-beta-N-acetylglucosaminidase
MSDLFSDLVKTYAATNIEFSHLKAITLAQWILESGRGSSLLAKDHLNFGGLKWRDEMSGFATPVDYQASDGPDKYCKFTSLEAFIKGYWHFIERDPYKGWRDNVQPAEQFIRFIGPIYSNSSYATTVLNLQTEAKQLLASVDFGNHSEHGTSEPVKKPKIKEFIQSPNHSSRDGGKITSVVVHYTTAGNVESTISHFSNPASEVSAHYIIDKNGEIYQMVKDADKAWHSVQANRNSIGIEHVAEKGDKLTDLQESASIHLIKWLMHEYKIPQGNILAHKQVVGTDCPGNIFGDQLNDDSLPKFKAWVSKNFSGISPKLDVIGPSGLGIYLIQKGDTLFQVAERHDMTLPQLLSLNPEITDPAAIFPGQKIKVAKVDGDERIIGVNGQSKKLNLPITIAESQLNSSSYQEFSHPLLGDITITGGFMEPHGHSDKPAIDAVFLNGKLKSLPPSDRNIGIDYVVENKRIKAWYGGIVTRAGQEGGYGRRVHIQLDVAFNLSGKSYQVYQAYAHTQEMLVHEGQTIAQGQQIAVMGGSGSNSDNDYPLHVDLSTYIFVNGLIVQLNPQALDNQLT